MSKEIDNFLGVTPLHEEKPENEIVNVEQATDNVIIPFSTYDVDGDMEFVKDNIRTIIDTGNEALGEVAALAKQADSPRAYEVVSTAIKAMLDANKEYVAVVEKQKEFKDEKGETENKAPGDVTNNILVMSSAEILEKILETNLAKTEATEEHDKT